MTLSDLEVALAAARSPTGIVYLEVNGLAQVNVEFGHRAGDEALAGAARRLESAFPGSECARVRSDTFAILVPAVTDLRSVERVAGQLEGFVASRPFGVEGSREVWLTAATGAVVWQPGEDVQQAFLLADDQLDRAAGRRRPGEEGGAGAPVVRPNGPSPGSLGARAEPDREP